MVGGGELLLFTLSLIKYITFKITFKAILNKDNVSDNKVRKKEQTAKTDIKLLAMFISRYWVCRSFSFSS